MYSFSKLLCKKTTNVTDFSFWYMVQPNSKSYRIQGEGKEARSNVFLTRNKMLHLYPLNLLEKKIKKPLYDVPGPTITCLSLLCSSQPVITAVVLDCPHSWYPGYLLHSALLISQWPSLAAERQLRYNDWRMHILHRILYSHSSCLRKGAWITSLHVIWSHILLHVSWKLSW